MLMGYFFVTAFLLIGSALLLFLMTSFFGRVWCGYGCSQTVFVEWVIRPIEEWIEGPALRRKRRDEMGLSFDKAWRKVLKYGYFFFVVDPLKFDAINIRALSIIYHQCAYQHECQHLSDQKE